MSTFSIKIVAIIIMLLLSALFSCSETAFFSLTRAQLSKLKRSNKGYARQIIKVLKNPRETLITILLGNELVNVAIAIAVASAVYDVFGPVSWKVSTLVSILIAAPLILVFGEVVPKNIAVRFPMGLVPFLVVPIRIFYQIVLPVRFLLSKFADQMVIFFGGDPELVGSMIMEEEFRQMVDLVRREGALEEGESELIHRIFELGNKKVGDIMTPVGEIFRLPLDYPLEKIVQEMREVQYSRVPVYRNQHDDIMGTLHSRDVFKLYRGRQRGHMQDVEEIVRPIHFVGEGMSIENLLSDFQKLKVHIAIVLDVGNHIVGLVTMDDIFGLLFTQKLEWKRSG